MQVPSPVPLLFKDPKEKLFSGNPLLGPLLLGSSGDRSWPKHLYSQELCLLPRLFNELVSLLHSLSAVSFCLGFVGSVCETRAQCWSLMLRATGFVDGLAYLHQYQALLSLLARQYPSLTRRVRGPVFFSSVGAQGCSYFFLKKTPNYNFWFSKLPLDRILS